MKDFKDFIEEYKTRLHGVFSANEQESAQFKGSIPKHAFDEIMKVVPLRTFIPTAYGGRGALTHEKLSVLEASSYESLPLSLMMGINGALFIQPLATYGAEAIKSAIFERFMQESAMGGLMITEPEFGSDALKMKTAFSQNRDSSTYNIQGTKHWGGLTGWANYWLITARELNTNGKLGRDISIFVHDTRNGGIDVAEYYPNLGIHMLPYGKNKVNINVKASHKLQPKGTGITMLLDILHKSRLHFSGMGMGFLKRTLDDAIAHCKTRYVGGKSLFTYDQVQRRLTELQSYFTLCSAMCSYTSHSIPLDQDTSKMDVPANVVKAVVTDFMQQAAQSFLQLTGAKGYRLDHRAGRGIIDSRPFQIFEGSNDILYQQISESFIKMMRKVKDGNLYHFLSDYDLTERASKYLKDVLNFEIDVKMSQRKLVELGKAIGRIITMEFTIDLGERGFNKALIENALAFMQTKVRGIMCTFSATHASKVVEDYNTDSAWLSSVPVKVV